MENGAATIKVQQETEHFMIRNGVTGASLNLLAFDRPAARWSFREEFMFAYQPHNCRVYLLFKNTLWVGFCC